MRAEADGARAGAAALEPSAGGERGGAGRWLFIRDVLTFQLKLFLDGLRDLVLAPLALVAGLVGLVSGREHARTLFYQVLRLGLRAELWINLFGVVEQQPRAAAAGRDRAVVDDYLGRIEAALAEQCAKGGVTRTTKERIDALLDAIAAHAPGQGGGGRRPGGEGDHDASAQEASGHQER